MTDAKAMAIHINIRVNKCASRELLLDLNWASFGEWSTKEQFFGGRKNNQTIDLSEIILGADDLMSFPSLTCFWFCFSATVFLEAVFTQTDIAPHHQEYFLEGHPYQLEPNLQAHDFSTTTENSPLTLLSIEPEEPVGVKFRDREYSSLVKWSLLLPIQPLELF